VLESLENISDEKRTQLSDLSLEIFTRSVNVASGQSLLFKFFFSKKNLNTSI